MKVIGITGPTGAGKTTALGVLEQMGCAIIDCDAVYHSLLKTDHTLQEELQQQFGPLTDPQGDFDRKRLGSVVFHDPAALERLNAIVYPHIGRAVEQLLEQARQQGVPGAAVDGITIFESGLAARCDITVAVVAPVEERVRRICLREGISRDYAMARVGAQNTQEWFEEHCDHMLVNDCASAEQFACRARDLFERLLSRK